MPTVAPARHRAGQHSVHDPTQRSVHDPTQRSVHDPTRRSARRVRYLLCDLFALLVLTAGGFYLAHSFGATSPPASGKVTALQTPATCGSSAGGSAADGSCAGHPYRAVVASVPPVPSPNLSSAPTRRHSTQPTPTASVSSSPAAPSPTASATGSPGAAPGTPAAQVLALINQARSAAGLPALTITAGLETSASAHDMTMLGGCGLSHQCPAEPDLGARETAAGVTWSACGENIGDGGPVADTNAAMAQMAVGLTQDMLNETPPDDGHRLNILSRSFAHIGIAVYRDSSGTVWLTQDFSN